MFGTNGANMGSVPANRLNRLAAIVEFSEDAIIGKDIDGIITEWNQGARQLYGYAADEVIGKPVSLLIPPDVSDDFPQIMQKIRRGESIIHYETVRKTKDGERVDVCVSVSPIRDEEGKIVGAAAIARDISERKRQSRNLIEVQERERARIARELHDDITQRLALFAVEMEQLKDLPGNEIPIRLEKMRTTVMEMLSDVQALSHELHSAHLEYLGIVPAMKSFCQEFGKRQKVEVEFESLNVPPSVPADISLCLFRVLQETLHDAAKHSGANRFSVQMRGTSDEIQLTVSDPGAGFDPEAAVKSRGLGLTSMKERLHLVKGEISIDSRPERGTTIDARVPLGSHIDAKLA
jgi:PAS domain S-box-containing protein